MIQEAYASLSHASLAASCAVVSGGAQGLEGILIQICSIYDPFYFKFSTYLIFFLTFFEKCIKYLMKFRMLLFNFFLDILKIRIFRT